MFQGAKIQNKERNKNAYQDCIKNKLFCDYKSVFNLN